MPAEELIDGLLILIGGILYLTQGVPTDLLALVVPVPFTHTLFKRWGRREFDRMAASGNIRFHFHGGN